MTHQVDRFRSRLDESQKIGGEVGQGERPRIRLPGALVLAPLVDGGHVQTSLHQRGEDRDEVLFAAGESRDHDHGRVAGVAAAESGQLATACVNA